ncbi:TPA: DUF2946 family protein [Pseudomonas aeruginosa]
MLYCCILVNALACSLQHGQMLGFRLSGLASHFCSGDPDGVAEVRAELGGKPDKAHLQTLSCPLCAAALTCVVLGLALAWLLRQAHPRCPCPGRERLAWPPRRHWPPANPRAP